LVVTSLAAEAVAAQAVYEQEYCARGDMENRIKEQQLDLFAGRVSCATMRANQVRLCLATVAYLVLRALRQHGLAETELASAQAGAIRLRLLKLGAGGRGSGRRGWGGLSGAGPLRAGCGRAGENLRALAACPAPAAWG